MEGVDLGSVFLRLHGDRSALDRELALLKRYTDKLEQRGIKVKFDADTGKAIREVDGLKNRLTGLNDILRQVGHGIQGDSSAWGGLSDMLGKVTGAAGGAGGGLSKLGGALGGAMGFASKAIPVLGQLGLAAQGLQAIFAGVTGTINAIIGPLTQLSQQAGQFNKQVAEASIFTTRAFAVMGPDGKAIQGTANQMRAVRGVITKEYSEIQKEVAKISGATASQIYEGFNLILQNNASLGAKGQSLENIRKLSTGIAAASNVLGVPGQQMRSEVNSLLTGDIQVYDQLAQKLYGPNARERVKQLIAEGKYYDDLMAKLKKLYEGQEVLNNSLSNIKSNFDDLNERIQSEGGQALERGLAKANKAILDPYTNLQESFMMLFRSFSESMEPILSMLGEMGGWFVSIGAACASALAPLGDLFALMASLSEVFLGPSLKAVGKIFQLIAKAVELAAKAVSASIRPWTSLLRVFTDIEKNSSAFSFFDAMIEKLDEYGRKLDEIGNKQEDAQRNFIRGVAEGSASMRARLPWSEGGAAITEAERQGTSNAGDVAVANYNLTQGDNSNVDIRGLGLKQETTQLLEERNARLGAGRERELNLAKELNQLVADRAKNEIQGLEQALKLMQAQKSYQEALNGLAESRRGLAASRAGFAVQVAGSPEARTEAEDRRNTLIAAQEQQRINEKAALLKTEREMLQTQLKIQLKQQKIQEDQLKIQRLELMIQKDKARNAALDIRDRMRPLPRNSDEYKSLYRQYKDASDEGRWRAQQIQIIERTIGLTGEMSAIIRRTNELEQDGLDVREQQLGIQRQQTAETRAQQALMTELQRREQAINAEKERQQELNRKATVALETEQRTIETRLQQMQEEEKLDRSRLDLQQARNGAVLQEAEARLKLAQAQTNANENPTSVQAVLSARIEALAQGTQGFVSEAEATRRVYEARQKQLRDEQEQQRRQLVAQQERERAELRLQVIKMEIERLRALNTKAELEAQREILALTQRRDQIAGSGGVVPAAPVLPPPAGGGVGNMLPGTRPAPNFNDGVGASRRGHTHQGQDLGIDPGDPIHARRAGRVLDSYSSGFGSVGGAVIIKYDNGQVGTYGHVVPGQGINAGMQVAAGQRIATVANDGQNTHLHYELRDAVGRLLNPLTAIRQSLSQPAGTIGGAASLRTSQESNASRLQENSTALQAVEASIARVNTTLLPALEKSQALQTRTLEVSQQSKERELRNQQIRDQLIAAALKTPGGRLAGQLTEATTGFIGGAIRGTVGQLVTGQPVDMQALGKTLMERMTSSILDAALAPLEKALTENLFKVFGGMDVDAAAQQQITAADRQEQAAAAQERAAAAQERAAATPITVQGGAGVVGASPVSLPVVPFAAPGGEKQAAPVSPYSVAASAIGKAAGDLAGTMGKTAGELDAVKLAAAQSSNGFGVLLQSLVSVAGVLGGSAVSGRKGGGFLDTLLGIATTVGSVVLSDLAGKAMLPKRAAGGPTVSNQAYLVGEKGPEIWMANTGGTVLPNNVTNALLGQGGAAGGGVHSVVNITVTDSGAKVDESRASDLGRMVEASVMSVINRELRTGGVLNQR